jgi:hypothetical protein
MALNQVINTRVTDYESKGELLNVAGLTLVNDGTAANDAIRKSQLDSALAALTFDNVVESTETSLADYIAANGTGLAEGTLLALQGAPVGDRYFVRRDYALSNDGTAADFIDINEHSNFTAQDFDDAYNGSDGIFIDATNGFIGLSEGAVDLNRLRQDQLALYAQKGDATTFTDLGLVETELEALAAETATHSKSVEYAVTWGAPDGNGIATATIDTSTDFGTKSVNVRMLKDLGDGFFEHISTSTLEIASNATSVRLRTDSGSIIAATHVVEVTGVPAV